MAWLSDSVPPLVKTISWGFAPMSAATCSRAVSTADRACWPGVVDGGGVGEVGGEIGKHGVENLGLDGRRGVVIEVDAAHVAVLSILRVARR